MARVRDRIGESFASLLTRWQATGLETIFERLVFEACVLIRSGAAWELRRQNIEDPWAIDETLSLVLEHLRKLPLGEVTPFSPRSCRGSPSRPLEGWADGYDTRSRKDPGVAYLRWLTRVRASDVARGVRQRGRREACLPFRFGESEDRLRGKTMATPPALEDDADCGRRSDDVQRAIEQLPLRQRQVARGLLSGMSQADLARQIGVCEGTVSRLRAKAIGRIREWLRIDGTGRESGGVCGGGGGGVSTPHESG